MAVKTKGKTIYLSDAVTVEEAQTLHEFLLNKKDARVDLSATTHVHTAALQVLMAARPKISRDFTDEFLLAYVSQNFI